MDRVCSAVGIPLLSMVLLLRVRTALLDNEPSRLSSSLRFIHSAYRPQSYLWEIIETVKKLL